MFSRYPVEQARGRRIEGSSKPGTPMNARTYFSFKVLMVGARIYKFLNILRPHGGAIGLADVVQIEVAQRAHTSV